MLKAYSFDVDSNLYFTDTTIFLDRLWKNGRSKIEVSQQEYEQLIKDKEHYRHVNGNIEESMINFKTPWSYEKAVFDAISKGNLWPSFSKQIEAKRTGSPTQKNTARGNSVEELKNTDRKIIYNVLTESQREDLIDSMKERLWIYRNNDDDFFIEAYLNNNMYSPCSNLAFLTSIHKTLSDSMSDRKNASFERFVLHSKWVFHWYYWSDFLRTRKIRIGFSDDTTKNIEWLHHFIHTKDTGLMRKYPEVLFRLYDTSETRSKPKKFIYTNTNDQE